LEGKILKKKQRIIHHEKRNCNGDRLSSKKVSSYAYEVWQDRSTAELMASEASLIIKTVRKRRCVFFSGKSEKGLLAGVFYLLGRKNKAMKTQREIARSLNTNDVTVRSSYREWLDAFPYLFDQNISIESHS
jgi:hypothetical protein